MNASTILSAKGQVVIPKDVRDRLRLTPGLRLDVVEYPDGVLLRRQLPEATDDFGTITARIRSRVQYNGPALAIEDMTGAIAAMWQDGGPRWDR